MYLLDRKYNFYLGCIMLVNTCYVRYSSTLANCYFVKKVSRLFYQFFRQV